VKVNYPTCFNDPKEFKDWVRYARQSKPSESDSFCTDCTPDYRDKMVAEKRCQFPDTIFVLTTTKVGNHIETELVGRRSRKSIKKLREQLILGDENDNVKVG
jgi:hypothetical protein